MNTFVDEAVIEVRSGAGGNGCIAFRREKYVPQGGPSGGDGGKGGDVVFTVRRSLRTLYHLRRNPVYRAESGRDGEGSERHGKDGEDIVIPLPPGALIRDADTDEVLHDFIDGADFLLLKGGSGGWGNVHFKSSVQQAPRRALPGKAGLLRKLRVTLEIIADIGFVGFPNAGKSSLLAALTRARPKIAPYPFTTKIPNLGVIQSESAPDVILADIPGLIEGAHTGAGLGISFLKAISRTRALAFLIDLSSDNYEESFAILKKELREFSKTLLKKKRIVLGTKLDMEDAPSNLEKLKLRLKKETVLGISVFSGAGLEEVKQSFQKLANEEG